MDTAKRRHTLVVGSNVSVAVSSTVKAVTTTDLRSEEHSGPPVHAFETYFPWACAQMQLNVRVTVEKVVLHEYVSQTKTTLKQTGKSKLKLNNMITSTSRDTQYMEGRDGYIDSDGSVEDGKQIDLIRLNAVYSGDNLVQINFVKRTIVTVNIIKMIAMIIRFYPQVTRITANVTAREYILYELSKLLSISNITELILDDCHLRYANYDILLDNPGQLTYLSLARCSIGRDVLKNLCAKLEYPQPASKTLNLLNLASNGIGDKEVRYIAQLLRTNRSLKFLNLSGNLITDDGAKLLLGSLKEFPLTPEEDQVSGSRYATYIKRKYELALEFMKKFKFNEADKISTKGNKQNKLPQVDNRVRRVKTTGAKSESEFYGNETEMYKRARDMAQAFVGEFTDPHSKYNCVTRSGVKNCLGNNSLSYLNLAYNRLTVISLTFLIKVLDYQKSLNMKPPGLIKICIEGNPLPEKCEEFSIIDNILEAKTLFLDHGPGYKKRRQTLTKKPVL